MDHTTLDSSKKRQQTRLLLAPKTATENKVKSALKNETTEVVMLTSYPPRECGIATFSSDLEKALTDKFNGSFKLSIIPLESDTDYHNYENHIEHTLNTDGQLDYLRISNEINRNPNCGLVLVQHEFGLFSGNEIAFFEFLEFLDRPIVFTFHTVLPSPDKTLRKKVNRMATKAKSIIVMTKRSSEILQRDYGVDQNLITVIPHGTHLIPYADKFELKEKYELEGHKVLSTFGLLGPGKNIETTLRALPKIIEAHPEMVFLIIGKTHPTLAKDKGEDYREFLKYQIRKLGLTDHVRFVNKFVPLPELLEYLQLTDIYLFTSKDPNQAVSGTFSYALSCGCPIVSTPIPHALEVLQNEAGTIFDFEDDDQLAAIVIDLLDDETIQEKMCLNGLHHSAESAWENAAIAHAKLFEKVASKEMTLRFKKPPLKLDHLKNMTTETGIIQFSKINQPDIGSGYTLDDNARALIAVCHHYKITGDRSDLVYIQRYFTFIKNCFRPEATFLNYVDEQHCFTDQNSEVNLEDANGRALWALGYMISIGGTLSMHNDVILRNAECIFLQGLLAMQRYKSPRAMAFILKGLYYFNQNRANTGIITTAELFADRMVRQFNEASASDWKWFEPYLTYGNSVLPEGLLLAYKITGEKLYKSIAKNAFDFLLSKIYKGDSIRIISNREWLHRGQELPSEFQGGEQPIDVAYTILALAKFHDFFPNEGYDDKMEEAFNWFMGDNALRQTIYNPCTGGCYDGLEKHNVNLNQGAESTISYLLARMAFEKNLSIIQTKDS
ncbi:glycosyltransferase [Costertonia aggregata]|uniref:Glycosyltransferase n=1 Tax=Costertonia aggregata TaxID=343403 RepID=A0A7H9AST4_9FLAO|nr:glycosyltransferase [Costertonia aggregata]QLG46538.1 glycosyltransferase [Costertonia aggregata]